MTQCVLQTSGLSKSFTLHQQGGVNYQVFSGLDITINQGECVVLMGESGCGKSSLLQCLYANYRSDSGSITLHHDGNHFHIDSLSDRELLGVRRQYIAYVSQFLRIIPRISTLDIVMQPMLESGVERPRAESTACELLSRLHIPEHLWSLSPTTFSGGEKQRVNIAREFALPRPLMLLDEPTASLDKKNRDTVIEMIQQAKLNRCAILGIFHDADTRNRVGDRFFDMRTQQWVN